MALFRPPIHRTASATLDRALFKREIPLAAARVLDNRHISRVRAKFEKNKDLLRLERLTSIRADPDASQASKGVKCLLLRPEVKVDGMFAELPTSLVDGH